MTKTVLLTLGRLPKGLDLARSFRRAGYRVIVAEPFRWHLMRVSNAVAKSYQVTAPTVDRERYLDDLLRIVRKEHVELIVPISEETLHVAALKNRLPNHVNVFTMPEETLLTLHDKHSFIRQAEAFGLDAPETYRLSDTRAASLADAVDTVIKPVFSCAGSGVLFLPAGSALPADDPARPMIVQARVYGDAISSFSITHRGRVLLTTLYRGTIMTGTVAVGFERVDDQPMIDAWIRYFVEQAGCDGLISFDFIVDGEGRPLAIECNPRVTSGVHFVATDNIAPIMLYPNRTTPPRRSTHRHLQQFWPCLTETQAAIVKPRRFLDYLRHLIRAKDVTWRRRDPLPFLLMPFTSFGMLWTAMTTEKTLGEAATDDIEYHGGEALRSLRDDRATSGKADAAPGR